MKRASGLGSGVDKILLPTLQKNLVTQLLAEIKGLDVALRNFEKPFSQRALDDLFNALYTECLTLKHMGQVGKKLITKLLPSKSHKLEFHSDMRNEEFRELTDKDLHVKACIELLEPYISHGQKEFFSSKPMIQWTPDVKMDGKSYLEALKFFGRADSLYAKIERIYKENKTLLSKYLTLFPAAAYLEVAKKEAEQIQQLGNECNTYLKAGRYRDYYLALARSMENLMWIDYQLEQAVGKAYEQEAIEREEFEAALENSADALVEIALREASREVTEDRKSELENEVLKEQQLAKAKEQQKARELALEAEQKRLFEEFQAKEARRKALHLKRVEQLRQISEWAKAQRRAEVVADHKAAHEDQVLSATPTIDENAVFRLLFALNPHNLTLLNRFYEKPTPDGQILFDSIVNLFGNPLEGKLNGSLTPGAKHYKIVIQQIIGFVDNEDDMDSEVPEKEDGKEKGDEKKASATASAASEPATTTGGTWRAHGKQKGGRAPAIVIEQVKITLERAGITKERLKLFCDAMVIFRTKEGDKTKFEEFLKVVREIKAAHAAATSTTGFTPLHNAGKEQNTASTPALSHSSAKVSPGKPGGIG